ncbi:aminodeoxychorismate/anthranilate synthase component II [Aurantimonas sp. VKM B-3413]|uniref:anthranilate synthase component II n=1 Tax=Aurantimonas sp. VKM B-3413 TaxID=2779401 RepID=UPI001E2D1297|nr:aminodeoxychorismate/anthranilate synthase component II [Aurantimonas sp. VKM B-3413]MCB8838678.1 aminodeoxychorismate/anthranilate synthase component II [Aurantimonas sp. VKM B-3413]
MKILVLDNYDSFVFNVARYLQRLGCETSVARNDETTLAEVEALSPEAVVVSPGPCAPKDAGISLDLVRQLSGRVPILGVCLGHQVIGEVFGGTVTRALKPMHGRASTITHSGRGIFNGLADGAAVGRYHSLIVEETPLMLEALSVDARSGEGEIMALSHREHPTYGVQFHPESVLTEAGDRMFGNFLHLARRWHDRRLD